MKQLFPLALLLLTTSSAAAEEPGPEPPLPTVADVQAALRSDDVAKAERLAARIAEENPGNGAAWFFLGYARQAQGKLAAAIEAHEKAAAFPKFAPVALYNLACARSLAGEREAAFEALTRARQAGFQPSAHSRRDPDLAALHDDPRFDAVLPPLGSHLPRGDANQFDFWLGSWGATVRRPGSAGSWSDAGALRLRVEEVVGGHGVVEYARGSIGGQATHGFSLRTFDPRENVWELLLLWPQPNRPSFSLLRGGFRHGRGEFFAGGPGNATRFTFSDVGPRRFRWDSATSKDRRAWTTSMVFSGTRAAEPVARGLVQGPATPELCPGPEFRAFDFLVGSWDGFKGRAIMGGAAVVTQSDDEYAIRAFVPKAGAWVRWELRRDTRRLVRMQGSPEVLAGAMERIRWTERGPDRLVRVRERKRDGAWVVTQRDEFTRAQKRMRPSR